MPRDECRDCGQHSPGGAGYVAGRCPVCAQAYADRQAPASEPESDSPDDDDADPPLG